MNSRLVKQTIILVLLLHSVIGYLLWANLCGIDASRALRAGEFVLGALAGCICSTAVLLGVSGFYSVKGEDDEALARATLNSLTIIWSLVFFGGVLLASLLRAK